MNEWLNYKLIMIFGDSAYKLRNHIMSYMAAGDAIGICQLKELEFLLNENKGKFKLLKRYIR